MIPNTRHKKSVDLTPSASEQRVPHQQQHNQKTGHHHAGVKLDKWSAAMLVKNSNNNPSVRKVQRIRISQVSSKGASCSGEKHHGNTQSHKHWKHTAHTRSDFITTNSSADMMESECYFLVIPPSSRHALSPSPWIQH